MEPYRTSLDASDSNICGKICEGFGKRFILTAEITPQPFPEEAFFNTLKESTGKNSWLAWENLPKVQFQGREYAVIDGMLWTQHAVERTYPLFGFVKGSSFPVRGITGQGFIMGDYGRAIPPRFIGDVIDNPQSSTLFRPAVNPAHCLPKGTTKYVVRRTLKSGNVVVITEKIQSTDVVITILDNGL